MLTATFQLHGSADWRKRRPLRLVYPHEILQNHFPQRRGSEDAEYVVRLSQATSPRSGFVQLHGPADSCKRRPLTSGNRHCLPFHPSSNNRGLPMITSLSEKVMALRSRHLAGGQRWPMPLLTKELLQLRSRILLRVDHSLVLVHMQQGHFP